MGNSFVIRSDVVVITIVGCAIAANASSDTAFAYIFNGSVFARVCLFSVIACAGFFCAAKSLQLKSVCLRYPILTPIGVAILVARFYVTVIDCVVFRAVVSDNYLNLFRDVSLGQGLLIFVIRTWNEDIIDRLVMMPVLAWMISFLRKKGSPPAPGAFGLAAVFAQVINICKSLNLAHEQCWSMT